MGALQYAAKELRADREFVQLLGRGALPGEELRQASQVVQLVGEPVGADISVRCFSMGGGELAVVRCARTLPTSELDAQIREALSPGLDKLVLLLPDKPPVCAGRALEPVHQIFGLV